jgi:hypothetical protein
MVMDGLDIFYPPYPSQLVIEGEIPSLTIRVEYPKQIHVKYKFTFPFATFILSQSLILSTFADFSIESMRSSKLSVSVSLSLFLFLFSSLEVPFY